MKKSLVLGLAIAVATSIELSGKPALANCDSLSYWQTTDGRCIDLTVLTRLGTIEAELSKPPVFSNNRIAVTNLRLIPNSIGVDVRGIVKNTSDEPIEIGMIDYEFVDSSGIPIDNGTFVVAKTINPGQTIAISNFKTQSDLQGHQVSSLSVRALKIKMW